MNSAGLVSAGLIGASRMGSFHAETLVTRLPGGWLAAIADPAPGAAQQLASSWRTGWAAGPARSPTPPSTPPARPASRSRSASTAATTPASAPPATRSTPAASAPRSCSARSPATPGWPTRPGSRRGRSSPRRSSTTSTRCASSTPVPSPAEVFALADALIRPDYKDRDLLDTAVVTVRFDNGALATAEASFQAVYGYDVRGEVLGSDGMLTVGDLRSTHLTTYGPAWPLTQARASRLRGGSSKPRRGTVAADGKTTPRRAPRGSRRTPPSRPGRRAAGTAAASSGPLAPSHVSVPVSSTPSMISWTARHTSSGASAPSAAGHPS